MIKFAGCFVVANPHRGLLPIWLTALKMRRKTRLGDRFNTIQIL